MVKYQTACVFACLLLCALLCAVSLAACSDHDSCSSCIEDTECAWCGDSTSCLPITSIPIRPNDPTSLDHPFYQFKCPSNWRVKQSVWTSNTHDLINWATDEQCEKDAQVDGADVKQTFGFEAETNVLYQRSEGKALDKHDVLFSDNRNQVTLDITSTGDADIEFVMFPPVSFSNNGLESLIETTGSMEQVGRRIGEQTLKRYTKLKSKNKLTTKGKTPFDFTDVTYSPSKHRRVVDEELNQHVKHRLQKELNYPWFDAHELSPELRGRFMNPFSLVSIRDTYLEALKKINSEKEQRTDPVQLPDLFTTVSQDLANTVMAGVQVTVSIPLNRVVNLFSLPDPDLTMVLNEQYQMRRLVNCLNEDSELTAGWTDDFKGLMTLLTYYTATFRQQIKEQRSANCQLINPKDPIIKINVRSNFYDLIRAVKSFSYQESTKPFPVQSAQDLIDLVKSVQDTCVPLTHAPVCTFEEIKLGGDPFLSKDGRYVTIGEWLTSIIDGPYDKLHDAHSSLAAFPAQFRGSSPAAIIEFRDPGHITSVRAGQLTIAMTAFFDFFQRFFIGEPLQPAIDAAVQCARSTMKMCDARALANHYKRLREEKQKTEQGSEQESDRGSETGSGSEPRKKFSFLKCFNCIS